MHLLKFSLHAAIISQSIHLHCTICPSGNNYGQLSLADRKSAGYCYDVATLLPVYNPLAVPIPEDMDIYNASLAASPLTTILVFGGAFGESPAAPPSWTSNSCLFPHSSGPLHMQLRLCPWRTAMVVLQLYCML